MSDVSACPASQILDIDSVYCILPPEHDGPHRDSAELWWWPVKNDEE